MNFFDAAAQDRIPGYQTVDNRVDEDARTPLAAHNQYWENAALAAAIRERIFARRTEDPVELAMAQV